MVRARMMIEHDGHQYSTVLGSDVQRDGMYLELHSGDPSKSLPVMEVFYSDFDRGFEVTTFAEASVPLAVVDQFLTEARLRLPPAHEQSEEISAPEAARDTTI